MARTADLLHKNLRPGIFRVEQSLDRSLLGAVSDEYFIGILAGDISDKNAFFAEVSRTFHFPDYFGWNWDALTDCLSDLDWLDNRPQHILLVWPKPSRLYTGHRADFTTLMRVLNHVIDRWWSRKVNFYVILESTNFPSLALIPQIYP